MRLYARLSLLTTSLVFVAVAGSLLAVALTLRAEMEAGLFAELRRASMVASSLLGHEGEAPGGGIGSIGGRGRGQGGALVSTTHHHAAVLKHAEQAGHHEEPGGDVPEPLPPGRGRSRRRLATEP